jgi:hypothetical protein
MEGPVQRIVKQSVKQTVLLFGNTKLLTFAREIMTECKIILDFGCQSQY